jgi:hypothetical protein
LPAGGVFGAAVTTKFTAVGLLPIFAALGLIHWWMQPRRSGSARHALRLFFAFATTAWVVVLLVYAPNWAPPPPLDPEQAARIGVPWWFRVFRPVLIPRDFFKGVALLHSDVVMGHPSFFAGEWRATGWWYLLPAAVVLKTPIPLLLILAAGTGFFLWRVRHTTFAAAAPWVAAIVYFAVATMDRGNVATRHLLPVYALAAIGAAAQINAQRLAVRLLAWALCGWLALVAIRVHPFFIEYFNEFAGGPAKGYRYLVDSNYDWGQGVKRLRKFLDEKRIDHIYLKYFGVQKAIEYYRISNTRISPEEARRAKAGTLVISATALMLPEWRWLRESRLPVARVGWTLFVYALNDLPQQAAPEDPPARHEPTDNPG